MIKALFLIFLPAPTWEQIAGVRRNWITILSGYFLPFLIIVSAVEGYGLAFWGKSRGKMPQYVRFPLSQVVVFEIGRVLITLAVLFVLAWVIRSLGDTFHGRHTFRQSFTVAAFGLGPLLLMRVFVALPPVSPWFAWAVGIFLSAATLYHGIPRVMEPDPPHAFGLYLMSVLLLIIISGLPCFVTAWYLQGKFPGLENAVANLAAHLPF
ncbi:MAG TPA: Yip1 family protein [Verrucomicrobiae bacterium]|nr:Yip1 family protein [Verrucomicrobiae bacterium]